VYLVYADESKDATKKLGIFCWVLVRDDQWFKAFDYWQQYRRMLRETHGIFVKKELHARAFISGRGRYSKEIQRPETRRAIYLQSLKWFADHLPIKLMFGKFHFQYELRVFERTINRINATMKSHGARALIFWDEGKQVTYTKMCRKLRVHNYIASMYGTWEDGTKAKNIPAQLILEDPVFKKSEESPFIQIADLCAYALLRREVPIESKRLGGLQSAFGLLKPLCMPEVFRKNKEGIITDE